MVGMQMSSATNGNNETWGDKDPTVDLGPTLLGNLIVLADPPSINLIFSLLNLGSNYSGTKKDQ